MTKKRLAKMIMIRYYTTGQFWIMSLLKKKYIYIFI